MNDRGFTLIELVVSLMIVSGILFSTFTVYQHVNDQSAQVMQDWKAFWKLKAAVRMWQQNGLVPFEEGESFQIQWSEEYISSTIMEGEFRIRWISRTRGKEKIFYAYKRVEPLPSS